MIRKFVFCEECRNDVAYTVAEAPMVGTRRGVEYHYTGREARCVSCHARVYVPEIIDYNLSCLNKEYVRQSIKV